MKAESEITSVADFSRIIKRYTECYEVIFYRGESSYYPEHKPGIMRNSNYIYNENSFYRDIVSMYPKEFENKDYLNALAKMQHYGIPTRLLDITIDPLIALYFACEEKNSATSVDGYLYMYIRESYSVNSKEVRLLSMRACEYKDISIDELADIYNTKYDVELTAEECRKTLNKSVFINPNEMLDQPAIGNNRLKSQKGTFFISGENDGNKNELLSIDDISPVLVFRIPASVKKNIQKELDELHHINISTIYPELMSGAKYLKEKYTSPDLSYSSANYAIISREIIKKYNRTELSIKIQIDPKLSYDVAKQICRDIVDIKKNGDKLVCIFAADTEKDAASYNWRFRGLYIPSDINIQKYILPLKDKEGNSGFSWEYISGATIMTEFLEENGLYKSDDVLFVSCNNLFQECALLLQQLIKAYLPNDMRLIKQFCKDNRNTIREINKKANNIGWSRNVITQQYSNHYISFFNTVENIFILLDREDYQERQIVFLIRKAIEDAKKEKKAIEEITDQWLLSLNITEDDLQHVKPDYKPFQSQREYIQSIPISENAIKVYFTPKAVLSDNGGIFIEGNTNLFDGAELLINVSTIEKKICGSGKTTIVKGKFLSDKIGSANAFMVGDIINLEISLSIPSTQPLEFVKQAGLEYENLDGPFILRQGYSPHGKGTYKLSIEKN